MGDGVRRSSPGLISALFTRPPASLLLGAAELLLHTVFISEELQSVAARRPV